MTNRHSAGHRDANEPEIITVLDNYHIDYIRLHEGAGADLLIFTNPMQLWECKDGSKPPSKRALTPVEVYGRCIALCAESRTRWSRVRIKPPRYWEDICEVRNDRHGYCS